MKHAHNTTSVSPKAAPKAASKATSTRNGQKAAGKKPPGNSHARDELVRLTAYSFYEARHGVDGSDLDDWLRAEAQIDQLTTQSPAPDAELNASTRAGLND